MSFFAGSTQDGPTAADEVTYRSPPWMAPPEHVVAATVPFDPVVLVGGPPVAVVVSGFAACVDGMSCRLDLRIHPDALKTWDRDRRSRVVHGQSLSIGFGFADGSRAVHVPDAGGRRTPWAMPDTPVISMLGGGGGLLSQTLQLWVWPLPPAGALTMVVASEMLDLPERSVSLDSGPIRRAAASAVQLWSDDRPFPPPPPWTGRTSTTETS
ncbi:MAG: hypothetical protein AB7W59_07240 [Acidimicrobiia bacterium]